MELQNTTSYTSYFKITDLKRLNLWWYLSCLMVLAISIKIMVIKSESKRRRMLASLIPGTDGVYIFGSLPILLERPENIINSLLELYRKYETTLFKAWIFNNLYIAVTRPEDIEFILTNPTLQRKSKEYRVLNESIIGQGILSIDDIKKWKINRKMVSDGFNFTLLKSFIPVFYEEANDLNQILQKKCNLKSNECDISNPLGMATMEIIGRTALGIKFNAQHGGRHRFVENLKTALLTWEYRVTHPWYLNKTLFKFSSVYKKHEQCQKIINEFTDEIINKKIDEINQNSNGENKEEIEDDLVGRKMKSFIEILLENYHEMSHEQIRDELVTIIFGGQETSAMTNACTLFMLAHYQDVQDKVFEEMQSIFSIGDYDRSPTYEDLQQMNYLERVIKETMRLYSAVPIIARRLEEEMKIGEHLCPAGTTLVISPLAIQTSPLYYADPKKFNPDNFLPEVCHSRHPYTYIPFSAGYRNCIGIKYGMLQMKTIVSTLVRKNKFLPSDKCPTPENLKLMYLITLKFADGCHIKIFPRNE